MTTKIPETCRTEPKLEVGRELAPMNQATNWREGAPLPRAVIWNGWPRNSHIVRPSLAWRPLPAWSPGEGEFASNPTADSTVSSGDIAAAGGTATKTLKYCGKVCFQGGASVIPPKQSAGKM